MMIDSRNYCALIPAAGVGARMNAAIPKQYLQIGEQSVLQYAVNAFLGSPYIRSVLVVVSPEDGYVEQYLKPNERVHVVREGGETRAQTVSNGIDFGLTTGLFDANDWVLVHDAARPGLTAALIEKLITNVADTDIGGLLAQPVIDTVKQVVDGRIRTIPRETLWLAQTPQMFRAETLLLALRSAPNVTDESSAIEFVGGNPKLIEGNECNRKLTRPEDLKFLNKVLLNHF